MKVSNFEESPASLAASRCGYGKKGLMHLEAHPDDEGEHASKADRTTCCDTCGTPDSYSWWFIGLL